MSRRLPITSDNFANERSLFSGLQLQFVPNKSWSSYLMVFIMLNLSFLSTTKGFTLNVNVALPKKYSQRIGQRALFSPTTFLPASHSSAFKAIFSPTRCNSHDRKNIDENVENKINPQQMSMLWGKDMDEKRSESTVPNRKSRNRISRQKYMKKAILGGLIVGISMPLTDQKAFAGESKSGGKISDSLFNGSTSVGKKSMVESLSVILASKKVLKPVERYIEIGQYDPGRTNVNYCTKILRVRRALENVVTQAQDNPSVDLDKLDTAIELTAVSDNNFSQLDSSIYTLIFIPNEGNELPPNSRKYLVMAQDYYKTVMDSIDAALALGSPEEIEQAQKLADKIEFPPFLFKEFKGDFYRAGTP